MNRIVAGVLTHLPWLLAATILGATVALVPGFRYADYWLQLSQQFFAPAVLALALTPVVLTGGIDLSVGSVTVFTSVVAAGLLRDAGWPLPAALLAAVTAGFAAGLLNGSLVIVGVAPLVATLATRELFRGLAFTVGGDTPVTNLPPALGDIWRKTVLGLPLPLMVVACLAVIAWAVVHHTPAGRMFFALGDNETAARFAGLPTRRLKLGLYAVAGLLAGLCGAALVLRQGSAKADAEKSLELTAITCLVLGGIRITGGSGHVAGTLLGTVTVAALLSGLSTFPPNGRDIVLGSLLLVVAVGNETARRWQAHHALLIHRTEETA